MRRRLDDHPSLNSSSGGVFNSNSAANSADSNSRTDGELNSNIPLTTSVTSSSTATPAFRSRRTLFAPNSPDNSDRPSIPRRPFALVQETVDAVGTSSNSEMQSGGQSRYNLRPRVAAATTLSQGVLGHSQSSPGEAQSSPGVHHTLSGLAEVDRNWLCSNWLSTQVVQPTVQTDSQRSEYGSDDEVNSITSSQAHDATTQMQGNRFQEAERRPTFEEALSYTYQVANKLGMQSQEFHDFLGTLQEFDAFRIHPYEVYRRFSNIFRGHPEFIVGFDAFTPPEDGICDWIRRNGFSTPGTNLASGGNTAPTSSTTPPGGSPTSSPPPSSHTQPNHSTHATSPHSSPGK